MANAKYGIRICNIAPAKVQTAMVTKNVPENHIMNVEHVANTVRWIYEQPQETKKKSHIVILYLFF